MLEPGDENAPPLMDEATVRHIAHLARLGLSDDEVVLLGRQLVDILSYVAQLDEVDTSNVEPAEFETSKTVFRGPELRLLLEPGEHLSNAPDSAAGAFRVPKVI